ncbi:hypothetical protein EXIGLDRAFT_845972 [Exidia glandulosa HHB12029]|uniref:Uncharacterized protein n=1 Tax=Exidia glandulosa HHB12029 TaxID=1314781 RepID=A0A165B7B7_EXIGL|nr:hypothetical protein EXIGLDRAFT_845972 [Exidia glandulosa HHB12029]
MPPKRASPDEDFFEPSDASETENAPKKPAAKRARKSTATAPAPDVSHILALKNSDLKKCEHDELVEYVEALQKAVKSAGEGGSASVQLSEEKLKEEVQKATNLLVRAMERSMTWKPSCKTGGAKVSYSGLLVDERVLPLMLGLKATDRFKAKRMTEAEFQSAVGSVEGSARYCTLYLKGNVNIKWDHAARTFTVSGSYGKMT